MPMTLDGLLDKTCMRVCFVLVTTEQELVSIPGSGKVCLGFFHYKFLSSHEI